MSDVDDDDDVVDDLIINKLIPEGSKQYCADYMDGKRGRKELISLIIIVNFENKNSTNNKRKHEKR